MAQLHLRLAALHPMALLYLRRPEEPSVDEALQRRCAFVREVAISGGAETGLQRRARDLQAQMGLLRGRPLWVSYTWSANYAQAVWETAVEWKPDVVQFEYHIMGQYLGSLGRAPAHTVLRQLEPGAATARDRNAQRRGVGRMVSALDCFVWRRYERDLLRRMDAVVTLTPEDLAAMRELTSAGRVVQIPLGIELPNPPFDHVGAEPPQILFVGNFFHPPNVAAAWRLLHGIFPKVKTALPEARLTIVGPNPPSLLHNVKSEGVQITGEVPDVRPFIDSAAVVVAPLDQGGGMRVKVGEALAAGKAVVASPRAVEGFNLTPGEQVLVAGSDEDFAEACLTLLRDPALRTRLGTRARAWASAQLGWDQPVAAFERLYASLAR